MNALEKAGVYAQRERKARKLKEQAIARAHRDRFTLRQIAQAVGMSNPGVLALIRRLDGQGPK